MLQQVSLFSLQPHRVLCHQGNYFVLEVVEPYVGFGAAIFILRGDDDKIHGASVGVVVNPRSGVYIDGFLLQMVKGGQNPGIVRMAKDHNSYV